MFVSTSSSHQLPVPSQPDSHTSRPPSYEQVLIDWLETDTIVNSVSELSPVNSCCDLPDVIPEHDEYRAMPHSLRYVLTPPALDASCRPRSILLEPALPHIPLTPTSPYSRPRWSPPDSPQGGVFRARQSVSSIGSCSTVHTRSTHPVKSILTRHDSGVSMATTTRPARRKKKRSPPSVKFVDAPTVHYDDGISYNAPPPRSPPSQEARQPTRWFTKWWKRSSRPPPRPLISGPYHLSYSTSLVDVCTSRPPQPKPGRLKQLWNRLTSVIG